MISLRILGSLGVEVTLVPLTQTQIQS